MKHFYNTLSIREQLFPQNPGTNSNVGNIGIGSSTNPIIICPKCANGEDVHTRLIFRKKKSSPKFRLIKKFVGHSEYEEKVPVQKKLNPAKAYNLFYATETPIRNPILSLPRLEREDIGQSLRLAIQELRKVFRWYVLPLEIYQEVFEKYPQIKEKLESAHYHIIQGYEVLWEIIESASKDNWNRSLVDWLPIYEIAIKETLHHASREYFATTSEGKRIYISSKHIKKILPRIQKFLPRYKKYVPFYRVFACCMLRISENDSHIFILLKEMELKYMRQEIPQLLANYKNNLIEVQGDTKGTFERQEKRRTNCTKEELSGNYYVYVEFRHPNKEEYIKQKSKMKQGERKSHPDGWRSCCTRKLDELPQNITEQLLERYYNKKSAKIAS